MNNVLSVVKTRKEQEEYINAKGKTKTRNIKIAFTETNSYYYEKDHLGSILAISDDTGTILEEYRYDAFGQPYSKLPDGIVTSLMKSPIGNTRLYTGREYDRGLGLYYNRARYYNPTLGRFISRDPIGIADDVNLYSYVKNNPVGFTDIFGLAAKAFVKAYDGFLLSELEVSIVNDQILSLKSNRQKSQLALGYLATGIIFRNYTQELYDLGKRKDKLNKILIQKESIAMKLHYARNDFNTNTPNSIKQADDWGWKTVIASYHQYDIPNKDNIKYVSGDGHREIVFNGKGNIDGTVENMGTYNFFSPSGVSGISHWNYDVSPYKRWGNAPGDRQIFD